MKGSGLKIYAVVYLLFLYAPVILLPMFAFNEGTIIAFPLRGFTFDWFRELMTLPELHKALGNSLVVAVSTEVLATCLGIFAARASSRYTFPGNGLDDLALTTMLMLVLGGVREARQGLLAP